MLFYNWYIYIYRERERKRERERGKKRERLDSQICKIVCVPEKKGMNEREGVCICVCVCECKNPWEKHVIISSCSKSA